MTKNFFNPKKCAQWVFDCAKGRNRSSWLDVQQVMFRGVRLWLDGNQPLQTVLDELMYLSNGHFRRNKHLRLEKRVRRLGYIQKRLFQVAGFAGNRNFKAYKTATKLWLTRLQMIPC